MNELIELLNNYKLFVEAKTWFMEMGVVNLSFLVFIIFNFFAISLTITINDKRSSKPKFPFGFLTVLLVYLYPNELWIAAIPFGSILVLLIVWPRPILMYLNLWLPKNNRMTF